MQHADYGDSNWPTTEPPFATYGFDDTVISPHVVEVKMDLELKLADDSHCDCAWSLYATFVRPNMFSGAPGRRAPADWNEAAEREKFCKYWDATDTYVIVVDDEIVGWAAIVKQENKITIENWQLLEAWRNKNISTIILGDLIQKWRAEGLEVEAAVLQESPTTSAAERVFSKLGLSEQQVEQYAKIMRTA
jgi:hypothetical protein